MPQNAIGGGGIKNETANCRFNLKRKGRMEAAKPLTSDLYNFCALVFENVPNYSCFFQANSNLLRKQPSWV